MKIEIDLTGIEIETQRLILRPWKESDLDDFYEYARVEGVGEMAGWPHHTSKGVTQMVLDSFISGKNDFAIVFKETGKVIGSFGIFNSPSAEKYPDKRCAEIGYVLSNDYWGNGLMPEAVKRVTSFCFDDLNIDVLTVGHFTTNMQSKRVIEKCGFTFLGTGKYYAKQLKKEFDELHYIMFR